MISNFAMQEKKKFSYLFQKIKYDVNFKRSNPSYFYPDGLLVFCGSQGSGKTLSAVNYVYNLLYLYPKSILVTNIDLTDFPVDNVRIYRFNDATDFAKYNNNQDGVIFLVDEIHLYMNSLKSKNMNIDVITQVSQQRKQRKHIVATCQVFGRMAKPLREQFSTVILCKSYFNFIQKNMLIDRDSIDGESSTSTNISGKVKKNYWYFRSPKMFKRYDTYAVIQNNDLAYVKDNNNLFLEVKGGIYGD